jgi:uncharacterized membrane protein YeiH
MIAALDLIATFAFALVGARLAADRKMDYGGILLVATVASLTGSTIRNLCLGERPLWLQKPWFFLAILGAVLVTILIRVTKPIGFVILTLDSIGLAFSTVVGVQYSLQHYAPSFAAVILGIISAVAGGLLRDVLCQVEPVLLHRETIGTCAFLGASFFAILQPTSMPIEVSGVIAGIIVVGFRALSIKYRWNLPRVS